MAVAQLEKKAKFTSMQRLGAIINGEENLEAGNPITPAEQLEDREGFNPDFLNGWKMPIPMPTGLKAKDMCKLKRGGEGFELKYMHFSVLMSKSRRMAMITAANIDGEQSKSIGRADKWFLDGRLDEKDQVGNELYKDNRLDRGHMVRREDPVWGDDAKQANLDTFHYTNSCPQWDMINQQVWLGLENYILKNARVDGMKVNVFTGPIFSHDDIEYRDVKIPNAFWKVVAIVKEDGTPSATAYKISQEKELGDLEAVYGKYKTFQISIQQVIEETNIDFEELAKYDGFSEGDLESVKRTKKEIRDYNDIMI